MFEGIPIKRKSVVKLVGYLFDERLGWSGMIQDLALKTRRRLGMLTRLRPLLDDKNMYTTFIRPILEYGSVQFMGVAATHLGKLDAMQRTVERIGRFKAESLKSRREAAAIILTLKLMAGEGRGVLNHFTPVLVDSSTGVKRGRESRHIAPGIQLESPVRIGSLDAFKRGYLGSIHHIWAKLPQHVIERGRALGWRNITKTCKLHLTGKSEITSTINKRVQETTGREFDAKVKEMTDKFVMKIKV